MMSGNVFFHVFEHRSNNVVWFDKKGQFFLFCKVVSKPNLHTGCTEGRKTENGKRWNGFHVAESSLLKQTYH